MDKKAMDFLIEAKQKTYASQTEDAAVRPLLMGSHQYEFVQAPFTYRDIYFGVRYFVGQETVYQDGRPYWAMSYGGGVKPHLSDAETQDVYAFLQSVLRQISLDHIFRGPPEYQDNRYRYVNTWHGHVDRFYASEAICHQDAALYTMHYQGGLLH